VFALLVVVVEFVQLTALQTVMDPRGPLSGDWLGGDTSVCECECECGVWVWVSVWEWACECEWAWVCA
jgi:hypothetical protein